jgi:ankyrin repeat protein
MRAGYTALIVFGLGTCLVLAAGKRPAPSFEQAIEAACEGRVDLLRDQIARGLNVNQPQENGLTLLMCAACLGQSDSVHVLIQAGAEVNAATPRGWTALMMAATNGHLDSARLLLRYGADATLRTECGNTARTIAEERAEWEFVELLAHHLSSRLGHSPAPDPDPFMDGTSDDAIALDEPAALTAH